jgi:hypothetical protein
MKAWLYLLRGQRPRVLLQDSDQGGPEFAKAFRMQPLCRAPSQAGASCWALRSNRFAPDSAPPRCATPGASWITVGRWRPLRGHEFDRESSLKMVETDLRRPCRAAANRLALVPFPGGAIGRKGKTPLWGAPIRGGPGESVTRGDRRGRELGLEARPRRSPAPRESDGATTRVALQGKGTITGAHNGAPSQTVSRKADLRHHCCGPLPTHPPVLQGPWVPQHRWELLDRTQFAALIAAGTPGVACPEQGPKTGQIRWAAPQAPARALSANSLAFVTGGNTGRPSTPVVAAGPSPGGGPPDQSLNTVSKTMSDH